MLKKLLVGQMLTFEEVTEEKYMEMLECLPPKRQASNGFLVGEPTDHNENGDGLYSLFITKKIGEENKYFNCGIATVKDFDSFIAPEKDPDKFPYHLICNCCGNYIKNTVEENVDFGTGRRDRGYGTCFKCDEENNNNFFNTRFKLVEKALSDKNKEKFNKSEVWQKRKFIVELIKKGLII